MRRTRARRRANSLDQATLKILAILVKEFPASDIQPKGQTLIDNRRPYGQPRRISALGSPKASGKLSAK